MHRSFERIIISFGELNLFRSILARTVLLLLFIMGFASCASVDTNNSKSSDTNTRSSSSGEETMELKAKIDELNNRIYVMNEQIEGLRARLRDKKLPSKVKSLPKSAVKVKTKGLSAEQKLVQDFFGGTSTQSYVAPSKSSNAMYKNYHSAYTFFKKKQFAKSLIAFSSFIDQYPNTVLTDNAYFWLAESYYKKKEYVLAIQEYLKILEKFPEASKAPDAALKLSYAYETIGDRALSSKYKHLLFQKYPKSKAAGISIGATNIGG